MLDAIKKIVDETETKKHKLFNVCLDKNGLDDYNFIADTLELQAYQKIKNLIIARRDAR